MGQIQCYRNIAMPILRVLSVSTSTLTTALRVTVLFPEATHLLYRSAAYHCNTPTQQTPYWAKPKILTTSTIKEEVCLSLGFI